MGLVDALSRKDKVDTEDDNWEVTLLKDNNQNHHIKALDVTLASKLAKSSPSDPVIAKALEAMNDEMGSPWIPQTANEDWEYTNGALYFKKCLYIPELT